MYYDSYLTFEVIDSATFNFSGNSMMYSLDSGSTWTSLTSGSNTPTLVAGNKIMWKRQSTATSYSTIGTFSASTGSFNVEGNIMSLIYGDDYTGKTSLENHEYAFKRLFSACSGLTNAENLILPAVTLSYGCYEYMFGSCRSLVTVPELPATTLNGHCYYGMFSSCRSLVSAPAYYLPATTMQENCYQYMFYNCKSLLSTPNLPATTLANSCYNGMFSECALLTTVPSALPATTLSASCYADMFSYCVALNSTPSLPAATLADGCYYGMFKGCSGLTTAPDLPATTLSVDCYYEMFLGCTSLTTAPNLPAETLKEYCYYHMFSGCTSLSAVTCLATNISASNCTTNWLRYVSQNGVFTKPASMTSWNRSYSGIPPEWDINDLLKPYNKYYIYKQRVSYDSGATWQYTGVQTYSGDPIDGYETLEECESGGLPTSADCLTFQLLETTPGYELSLSYSLNDFYYSYNSGITWNSGSSYTNVASGLSVGDTIMFKADRRDGYNAAEQDSSIMSYTAGQFYVNGGYWKVFGHISSVVFGEHGELYDTVLGTKQSFWELFYNCGKVGKYGIRDAGDLHLVNRTDWLPGSSVGFYGDMFSKCETLITAPDIPLCNNPGRDCYRGMFSFCYSLVNPPTQLPSSNIAWNTYKEMFSYCTSLTHTPAFPSLFNIGYQGQYSSAAFNGMFKGCSSLQSFDYTLAINEMGTPLHECEFDGMFSGCTSLTGGVSLRFNTLNLNVYGDIAYCMFEGTNINSISLSVGTLTKDIETYGIFTYFEYLVDRVPSTGTLYLSIPASERAYMESSCTRACKMVPQTWGVSFI